MHWIFYAFFVKSVVETFFFFFASTKEEEFAMSKFESSKLIPCLNHIWESRSELLFMLKT